MCDTIVVRQPGRTLFAKNSDRPLDERQLIEAHPRRAAGGSLTTTYLEIPDSGAHAFVGARPDWMWGCEHGVNEHRVAIGNERVYTSLDANSAPPALIGMDLVRLGLERGGTADEALDAMTSLLEEYGQGGMADAADEISYFSSFLIADPSTAWQLETSGSTWAARRVTEAASISNRITIGADWDRGSPDLAPGTDFDQFRDQGEWTGHADRRLDATRAGAVDLAGSIDPAGLVALLRHHGRGPWGQPGTADRGDELPVDAALPAPEIGQDGSGVTVCMHIRGYQATASSIVADLPADPATPMRVWVAPGSPCCSVYLPVETDGAAGAFTVPTGLGDSDMIERFATIARRVEDDPDRLSACRSLLDPVEARLWKP